LARRTGGPARHASAKPGETSQLGLDNRLITPSGSRATSACPNGGPHCLTSRLVAAEVALSFRHSSVILRPSLARAKHLRPPADEVGRVTVSPGKGPDKLTLKADPVAT
jgi:hypothetical protein